MNMKRTKIYPALLFLALGTVSPRNAEAKVNDLLPYPHVVNQKQGSFLLNRSVQLNDATGNKALRQFLADNGCTTSNDAEAKVSVTITGDIEGAHDYTLAGFDNEAYTLDITDNAISIKAVTAIGVTRAIQTLTQLAEGYDDGAAPELELVSITDWPAFKLRGWMQDVGRSFLSVEELKKEIRLLSRFKVNVFHWHLTEKLAWRFQVNAYPELTADRNMTRYPGKFYTQAECREIEEYAAEHGITVIPEIDMPGHSDVFTQAMGFDMQSTRGRTALKKILDEVAATFTRAPYIHIGGDEVSIQAGFLEEMAGYVRNTLHRKVLLWNPLMNKGITSGIADMTQMWSANGKLVSGMPNIDCRYNYINHFDVYADLVGIYKSNIYYAQQGSEEIAGTITATWNDTKTETETDIIRQNNQYANILASAERAWKGGGKQYIEQGGTTLPNSGEEYDEFADFERRFLFHKAHSLKEAPIPYVKQSNVHWRITEPFPNGGNASLTLPPERCSDDILPKSFTYNGTTYSTSIATGAGIYLRHIWHSLVPSYFANPSANQTAYAWTYVYSPIEQEVGAQIEFYTYSRSGSEYAPKAGQWDRRGSRIWLNDKEIPAPEWEQTDCDIPQDDAVKGLKNENLTARNAVGLHLNKGWNKVFMKLPHANSGGTKRDKWQFTFVITDTEGNNAVEGLTYSPDKTFDTPKDDEDSAPTLSDENDTYWYQFSTPLRDGYYPTSAGDGGDLYAQANATRASEWKFEKRQDGTFNIVNRADDTFVSPVAEYNTALKTVAEEPESGWAFNKASTKGYYTITSGTTEMNQTRAVHSYKVFNWGEGTNTTDTGCQFMFNQVAHEHHPASGISTTKDDNGVTVVNRRIVSSWPYRLYSNNGQSLPIGKELTAGVYLVKTATGTQKVVVK